MNITIIIQLAAVFLLLSPLAAQANTMSSSTYSSESGSTLAGAGSASSPGYSSRAGAVGNAFAVPPGSTSPSYTLNPAIPANLLRSNWFQSVGGLQEVIACILPAHTTELSSP